MWPFKKPSVEELKRKAKIRDSALYSNQSELHPQLIDGQHHLAMPFQVMDLHRIMCPYYVLSTQPVQAFVVDNKQYTKFMTGRNYQAILNNPEKRGAPLNYHDASIAFDPDFDEQFYFLVINNNEQKCVVVLNVGRRVEQWMVFSKPAMRPNTLGARLVWDHLEHAEMTVDMTPALNDWQQGERSGIRADSIVSKQ